LRTSRVSVAQSNPETPLCKPRSAKMAIAIIALLAYALLQIGRAGLTDMFLRLLIGHRVLTGISSLLLKSL